MFESLGLLSLGAGGWGGALLAGAGVTMALALACVPLGLPLGLLVALCSRSANTTVRAMAALFSTCFRGLPELLTLLIVYYGIQIALQQFQAYWGGSAEFGITRSWRR